MDRTDRTLAWEEADWCHILMRPAIKQQEHINHVQLPELVPVTSPSVGSVSRASHVSTINVCSRLFICLFAYLVCWEM